MSISHLEIMQSQDQLDDNQRGKYFCVYFDEGRYWGRLEHVFSEDSDEPADKVQINFLKYSSGGYWDIRKKSKPEIIDAKYVFMGPCIPSELQVMDTDLKKMQGPFNYLT